MKIRLKLEQEPSLENAYRASCSMGRLELHLDTKLVYDWFRYAGYVRWAEPRGRKPMCMWRDAIDSLYTVSMLMLR